MRQTLNVEKNQHITSHPELWKLKTEEISSRGIQDKKQFNLNTTRFHDCTHLVVDLVEGIL